jgi:hypothetical protein
MAKCVGTVLEIIGKIPYLQLIGIAGTAIHGIVDLDIGLEIVPEIIKLRLLEMLVAAISPVKEIARIVIPLLGVFSDEIAGIGVTQGAIWTSTNDTISRVRDFYGLETCVVIPDRLPVFRENAPSSTKNKAKPTDTPWNSNDSISSFSDMINKVVNRIGLDRAIMDAYYAVAKSTPRILRDKNQKNIVKEYPKIEKYLKQAKNGITNIGYMDNPSLDKLKEFDLEAEKLTQFVRATNPYVDSIRSPMRAWFRKRWIGLPVSNISSYFTHWTYRYVLNESYNLRNGEYGIPAHMLVLDGWDPKRKGNESWTDNPAVADETFSLVIGILAKERIPIFSPTIYTRSRPSGDVALAQGMIYNLNARNKNADSSGKDKQPTTGWDTLQWEPQNDTVRATEWNAQPFGLTSELAPWKFFSSRNLSSGDPARVKLNWQAKLRPVTKNGADQFSNESNIDPTIKRISGVVADHSVLLSH